MLWAQDRSMVERRGSHGAIVTRVTLVSPAPLRVQPKSAEATADLTTGFP